MCVCVCVCVCVHTTTAARLSTHTTERPRHTNKMASQKESSAAAAPTPAPLRLFQQLDDAQSHHGIPVGDYAQYAGYCTRKLARVRHHPAVRTQLVHNPKYAAKPDPTTTTTTVVVSKRRHGYCPRNEWKTALVPTTKESSPTEDGKEEATTTTDPPTPAPVHENIFWNLFYQAERAWAQACALQQQSTTTSLSTTRSSTKTKHGHVQRRFNKAFQWATALAHHMEQQQHQQQALVDTTTRQESQAYVAWMAAHVALEHQDYVQAFRQYNRARQILLQLASASSPDGGGNTSSSSTSIIQSLAIRDVWTQRAETVILPVLRYCQYEAKDALMAEEIYQVTSSNTASSNTTTTNKINKSSIVLSFRGQDIALDADASYQPIAVLYLKMEDALQRPDTLNENQFLQLLSDLDDAIQKVADEIQNYQAIPNPGPAVTAKLAALTALEGWFRYHKMSTWSYQQEQHISEFQNAQNVMETVHLYEALQQNAVRMAELPGVDNEDDPYRLEALAHVVRLRAFRCYYLALAYEQQQQMSSLSSTWNTQKVLALLPHAAKLAERAREEILACHDDPVVVERHVRALDDLVVQIRAVTCRVQATQYLYHCTSTATTATTTTTTLMKTNRPLWMRLEDCDAGTVLADVPLRPLPIPCKGVTYDLAGSRILGKNKEVSITTLEQYIHEQDDEEDKDEPQKKTGFLRWFS